MMRTRLILTTLALVAVCAFAHATPSTLVWIPATDIEPNHKLHLDIDSYFGPGNGTTLTDYGLTYGFLNGRAEVGFDYFAGYEHPLTFNGKYLLCSETATRPALAIGGYFFGIESGVSDANVAYLLGSKTFGKVRATLGYAHGKQSTIGGSPNMLLVGFDGNPSPKWWWGADYQSGDSSLGAVNFGVEYKFTDNIGVIFGYDIYNQHGLDNTFNTQLDVDF